jgi:hypothetical protein
MFEVVGAQPGEAQTSASPGIAAAGGFGDRDPDLLDVNMTWCRRERRRARRPSA